MFATFPLLTNVAWGLFNWNDLQMFSLHVLPLVTALISVVALVAIWLSGVGRYGKDVKSTR